MNARAGLYVHIPFCSAICPYCDFAVVRDDPKRRSKYLAWIEQEILLASQYWTEEFETVYFGGGTPSALTPEQFRVLAGFIREHLPVQSGAIWHLEANPEDIDRERLDAWRAEGVDFLSLGTQSFSDPVLKFLGRRHSGAEAEAAVALAKTAGFRTVSADLIFGLPRENPEDLDQNFQALARLQVDHLSLYQLTIHEETPFDRRRRSGGLVELNEDGQADLYLDLLQRLAKLGLKPYEVSNFARGEDSQSPHNRKYWRRDPYLGLGLGAHSFDGRVRSWNHRDWDLYGKDLNAKHRPVADHEELSAEEARHESIMLSLRTAAGLDLDALRREHQFDLEQVRPDAVRSWQKSGHLKRVGNYLQPQGQGFLLADAIARDFF